MSEGVRSKHRAKTGQSLGFNVHFEYPLFWASMYAPRTPPTPTLRVSSADNPPPSPTPISIRQVDFVMIAFRIWVLRFWVVRPFSKPFSHCEQCSRSGPNWSCGALKGLSRGPVASPSLSEP